MPLAIGVAHASVPTDFLTQQVCISGGVVTNADPVTCPTSRRHLNVGEALPYHKIDLLGIQISDSYPIADLNGVSKAVQTYFYTSTYQAHPDPRFTGMVHFNAQDGGYNILGADSSNIFFRGTWDPAGGWQPWWTSGCQAKGWLVAPNTSSAFAFGSMGSPTMMYPDCPGTGPVAVTNSWVDWDYHPVTYAAAGTPKTLDSIVSFHFAGDGTGGVWGPAEVVYLTQEYGVTRWEAWSDDPAATTPSQVMAQCPSSLYSATLHTHSYKMVDCHDWSTIDTSMAPWDPTGHAPGGTPVQNNPLTFAVDPLYTSHNWLKNTHIGGPYAANTGPSCDSAYWNWINSPAPLTWAWDNTNYSPFNTLPQPSSTAYAPTGNCTMVFTTPSTVGGQALYQQITLPVSGSGQVGFGGMMWAPDDTDEDLASPHMTVRLFQLDSSGSIITWDDIEADLSSHPNSWGSSFTLSNSAKYLTIAFYPWAANTRYEVTGAWVAPLEPIAVGL